MPTVDELLNFEETLRNAVARAEENEAERLAQSVEHQNTLVLQQFIDGDFGKNAMRLLELRNAFVDFGLRSGSTEYVLHGGGFGEAF